MRCGFVLLLMLSLGAAAHAQDVCPWLTQGTAATLMGGEVSTSVHVAGGEGMCEFLRRGSTGTHSLAMRIAVNHQTPQDCPSGERLTGIGQDAALCTSDAGGEHHVIIRGRVRSIHFLLTLVGRENNASEKALMRTALEQAAEEVAGNLF